MPAGIYLRRGEQLVAMSPRPYEAEVDLQRLLAQHPELLSGDGEPRRYLLIAREYGVPAEEDGASRWSLDHLFVDEGGIPTLVEVKQHTDTRIRREVVGQMLDYAANALTHWSLETIKIRFGQECEKRGQTPEERVRDAFGGEMDIDDLWINLASNLHDGRLRLVFVADEIPDELKAIVEFLNGQMAKTDVLAIEVRQFADEHGEHQTLVPRVIGQTEAARQSKDRPRRRHWERTSWLAELSERGTAKDVAAAEALFAWANEHGILVQFGTGTKDASAQFGIKSGGYLFPFFVYLGYRTPYVQIQFAIMLSAPYLPFDQEDKRLELGRRLNSISNIAIPDDDLAKFPSFPLSLLADPVRRRAFLEAMEWAIGEARQATSSQEPR